MQEINIYDVDGNIIYDLAQWDKNVNIYITEPEIDTAYKVHFFNRNSVDAMVVQTTYENGTLRSIVPNDILTEDLPINGYVFVEKNNEQKSLYCFRILVRKRVKPADYIYTDQKEYISYKKILKEAEQYALTARSYTIGDTSLRPDESTNNARYFYNQSKTNASNAKESETNAKTSETNSKTSETNSKTSETNSKTSEINAKTSETNAKTSETNAKTSETKAKTSEVNAKTSETNASNYATSASNSATSAHTAANTATTKANEANSSATIANTKATEASKSANAAKTSEQNAKESEEKAKTYAENASAVTGINIATDGIAGIIKGGENHIAEDGTLQITRKTTDTTLSNSHAGGIRINEIIGKSEQKSYSGKNLFDIASALDAYSNTNINLTFNEDTYRETGAFTVGVIDQTIGQITELILSPGNQLVSGNTYYISFYCDQPSPEVKLYIGSEECTISDTELNVFQFTSGNMINFDFDAYSLGDVEVTFSNMMISASADTTYEKYVGGIPSPNPDNPQEIKSVEVGEIKSVGKNLLDCSGLTEQTINGVTFTPVYENGLLQYINVNGTATNTIIFNVISNISFSEETIMTSGVSGTSTTCKIDFQKQNGGELFVDYGSGTKLPMNELGNIRIVVYSGNIANNLKFYPMIRLASIDDSTYEPYQSSTVTLSSPITLRGIGEAKDRIVRKNGAWGVERWIGKHIFDGSEYWLSYANTFYTEFIGYKKTTDIICMCDKYVGKSNVSGGSIAYSRGNNTIEFYYPSDFDRIYIRDDSCSTIEEFIDKIKANNFTVYYVLATPTFEPLPTADQIALNSLLSFDAVTYISTDSEIEPVMNVEYGTSKIGGYIFETWNMAKSNKFIGGDIISDTEPEPQGAGTFWMKKYK